MLEVCNFGQSSSGEVKFGSCYCTCTSSCTCSSSCTFAGVQAGTDTSESVDNATSYM